MDRTRKKVHAGYDFVMGLCPDRPRNGREAQCAGMPQPLASLPFRAIGGSAMSSVVSEHVPSLRHALHQVRRDDVHAQHAYQCGSAVEHGGDLLLFRGIVRM